MEKNLYYGDNLEILQEYIKDESIDLCYIDPPFNSNRNYNQIYSNEKSEDKAQTQAFIDTWTWDDKAKKDFEKFDLAKGESFYPLKLKLLICGLKDVLGEGSMLAYLVSIAQRIKEIHRVLKPTGSFYLHCDSSASHYLKLILDCIFNSNGFRNEIIWCYTRMSSPNQKQFSRVHDNIFWYSKSKNHIFNKNEVRIPYAEGSKKREGYANPSGKISKGDTVQLKRGGENIRRLVGNTNIKR